MLNLLELRIYIGDCELPIMGVENCNSGPLEDLLTAETLPQVPLFKKNLLF